VGFRAISKGKHNTAHLERELELGLSGHPDLHLVEFDLTDLGTCIRLLHTTGATEIYNLVAMPSILEPA
jgi:GDP-D-mannose dehydratase